VRCAKTAAPHLRGSNTPISPHFETWIGIFIRNSASIKTGILLKLLHRFQPNFALWQKPLNSLRGWSKRAYNKSNMADGCHFEKKVEKSYLSSDLTDLHEIVQDDAHWPSERRTQLKIRIFENPGCRTAVILKQKLSNHHNSATVTVRRIAMKFGSMTHYEPLKPRDRQILI